MNEPQNTQKTKMKQNDHDPTIDSVDEAGSESPSIGAGLRERVRWLLNSTRQRGPGTKQESAKGRTRSLVLLIGGTVGAVLVFMGVFSTPTTLPNREKSGRASANLGRPIAPNQATATQGSAVPLLNADVGSNQNRSDQLSPADIRGTSPRASGSDEVSSPSGTMQSAVPPHRVPPPQPRSAGITPLSAGADADPLAAYRVNNNMRTPTYSYGGPPALTPVSELPANDGFSRIGMATNQTGWMLQVQSHQ